MLIGINAAAADKQPRTGVEEYTFQLIKHLAMLKESRKHRFILYSNKNLKWPLPMWTQLRLAGEMVFNRPDVLFIPVHVLPIIHPENSVVTVHGLEYEYYPMMYPRRRRAYLRWSTQYALKRARKIIAVSNSTKNDLIKLYGANPDKIEVIYHGCGKLSFPHVGSLASHIEPYILFIGRLETKKNVEGLIKAFELLKKKYQVPHQLILAGPPGYGYDKIKFKIQSSTRLPDGQEFKIIELGYVSEAQKWQLFSGAEMFVFPSFCEGFGMPILEAQAAGCPVVTSNVSSMPEVAGGGAVLIDPDNIEQICQGMYKIIDDRELRSRLIKEGRKNTGKFSWQKCAQKTLRILTE